MAEKVQEKFSSQREALHSKKEDISKMDLQIAELWRKLRQAKSRSPNSFRILSWKFFYETFQLIFAQ